MKLPIVKIDDGKGSFVVINEEDFDAKIHSKYGEKQVKQQPAKKQKGK